MTVYPYFKTSTAILQVAGGYGSVLQFKNGKMCIRDRIEETKTWVLSPERKAPQKERDYAAARLDGVINKIKRVMQHALAKIQRTLMQPEVKQAGKEQVKKKAKESIMDMLAKTKINACLLYTSRCV